MSSAQGQTRVEGAKGCRVCVTRRIRCDLERPSCRKCVKKGLDCPGYGPRIKWVGGVAARGRLRGRSIPEPKQREVLPLASRSVSVVKAPGRHEAIVSCSSSIITGLGSFNGLIEYYGRCIAGLMVWLDSDQNDYRRHVLPLAQSEPGLRLAVAAISAHHGSSMFPHNPPNFPDLARDACLNLVKEGAKEMTSRLTSGRIVSSSKDVAGGEWMLASVLIMLCFEMVQSRLDAAECHKKAARTLVSVLGPARTGRSDLFRFLQNQLAIHDVLASTTSFDLENIRNTVTPPDNSEAALFSGYLASLHQVTLRSRQPKSSDAAQTEPELTAPRIRSQFEQARGATLMAAGALCAGDARKRQDIVDLVEVYHSAALLYSYRCVGLETLDPVALAEHSLLALRIPEQLLRLGSQSSMCIQNLPWPALVAGTECHGDGHRQARVTKIFLDIYEATKFGHYLEILDFLHTFWSGAQSDWRLLARSWELAGRRIIPV